MSRKNGKKYEPNKKEDKRNKNKRQKCKKTNPINIAIDAFDIESHADIQHVTPTHTHTSVRRSYFGL